MRKLLHLVYLVQDLLCSLKLSIYEFHQLWKILSQYLLEYLLSLPVFSPEVGVIMSSLSNFSLSYFLFLYF
jgi:hypothetical protein